MIPLMVQKDYRPKGWLGLILGTRMWYPFWDAGADDDAAFESRMDALCRELGDRGRVSEGVPPAPARIAAPAPAPALNPAPAPAPAPTPSLPASTTPQHTEQAPADAGFTPSVRSSAPATQVATTSVVARQQPQPQQQQQPVEGTSMSTAVSAGSLSEISSFVERMMAQSNAEHEQLAAKLEARDATIDTLMSQLAPPSVTSEQLAALQARLEGLHAADFLSETELHALEDLVADFIELRTARELASVDGYNAMLRLAKLIDLSEGMPADRTFARQARRKFV
jgi:hypothetical protein